MIKTHFSIWACYWVLVWLLPAHSKYSAVLIGFLIQFIYVILVGFGWFYGSGVVGHKKRLNQSNKNGVVIKYFLAYISVVSVGGFLFLAYDKIVVQGISFSDGLGLARVHWQNNADERSGRASSVFSALGYLFGQGYFLIPSLLVHYKNVFKRRLKIQYGVIAGGLAIANSIITGGRSTILLFFAFLLMGLLTPGGQSLMNWRLLKRFLLPGVLVILITIVYSGIIFLSRAGMNDIGAADYVIGWIDELTLVPDPALIEILEVPIIGEILGIGCLCVAYVTHSFSVTTAIWEMGSDGKQIMFGATINLIARTGFFDMKDLNWFLYGKLASLPGSLFYQYGWFGLIFVSILIGAGAGILYTRLKSNGGVPSLMLYAMFGSTIVLGPSFFALDFLMAPFIVSSVFSGYAICYLIVKMIR